MAKIKKYQRQKTLKEEAAALDVELDESKLSVKEVRKLFKRGNLALRNNNYPLAAKHFFKAWEADQDNLYLLTVVSHLLSKLGHQAVAIEFLEKAIAIHGLTEDICKVMGEMALSLEMFEAAEKIFAQAVQFNPQEEKYYINIATALEGQGNVEGAIQFMGEVVKILDESSDCWCHLGTLCKSSRKWLEANRAFSKSLKINPDNIVALNNYAGMNGVAPDGEKLLRHAISLSPGSAEPHVMLATYLHYSGELEDAWKHYEYRNDPSRGSGQTVCYTHNIKVWQGEKIDGKTFFLTAEQGIGDEVYFSQAYHKLIDKGAKIIIGCDKRLINILERSYPGTRAFAFNDELKSGVRYRCFPEIEKQIKNGDLKINYSLPIGSIPLHFWKSVSDVKQFTDGYLRADNDQRKQWQKKLQSLGNKPKIGISWRSGYIDKSRVGHYVGLENLLPMINEINADFICLQYDCTPEELREIEDFTGKALHVWPEIDLKNDIEANLAIMENLDLVIGPNIATQMLALACGTETWLLGCRPWWAWGAHEGNTVHHAPKSRYWVPETAPDGNLLWPELVANILPALKDI